MCDRTTLLFFKASELSTDNQALTHYQDIVYEHDTAGRHLIVGLDKNLVYGHSYWSTDTDKDLRTPILVYGHLYWSTDIYHYKRQ